MYNPNCYRELVHIEIETAGHTLHLHTNKGYRKSKDNTCYVLMYRNLLDINWFVFIIYLYSFKIIFEYAAFY